MEQTRCILICTEHDGDEAQKGGAHMFERFTDQARRVLALAREEARMRNCNRVGTEHLLLGLIHERDGLAAVALESLGISAGAIRQQVEEIIGQYPEPSAGYAEYTMRAKKALDLSRREALQLGHNHIGTEHLLLSLIREGEGPAAQVLLELGADLSLVRQQVLMLLGDDVDEGEAAAAAPRTGVPAAPRPGAPGVPVAAVGESRLLVELLQRIEDMDARLSSVEQRLGAGPDVRDLDQQIAQARRDKESAVGAEDYENAAALRNREHQLLADKASRQKEWATAHLDLPAVADKLHVLTDEVARLRALLRQKGIEPRDGAA
jgi:ATP-dependent Clp protease ATP-binding subunit ClpA